MNKTKYIVYRQTRWTSHHRTHRAHHTHRSHKPKAKDGHHRHSEKPPGWQSQYFLYRNAKFAPVKTRGEFGVSHHALSLSARRRNSGVGCRDPPDQSF